MIKKCVIPAAGHGTRFRPITKSFPKEMLPIIDKPNLEYLIEEAILAGIEEIIIIINKNKEMIQHYFGESHSFSGKTVQISYIIQNEQLGLGHAILQVRNKTLDEPFLVILGDDLYDYEKGNPSSQLIKIYMKNKTSIIGLMNVKKKECHKYGCFKPRGKVSKKVMAMDLMVEKPKINPPSTLVASGRYLLTSDIFNELTVAKVGQNGEIGLTESLVNLAKIKTVEGLLLKGLRFDNGDKRGYLKAFTHFAKKRGIR